MRNIGFAKILCIIALFCVATTAASHAQTLTTLVNFDGANGRQPSSAPPLVQGTDGNLYGVTYFGGNLSCPLYSKGYGCGTVFKMTPAGELTTLYSFCTLANCTDGANPESLIQATDGNFYGVAFGGGQPTYFCPDCGTIFKITPSGVLTTLYTFCPQEGCTDGEEPYALIQATNGNFYGVAWRGGGYGGGSVFELTSSGKFSTLYSFCQQFNCPDGSLPVALMQASNKNFYGSNTYGGKYNAGSLFEITPGGTVTILDTAIRRPNGMIQGADGDLYGTTEAGGVGAGGIVFKLNPAGKEEVLHNFCSSTNCPAGFEPASALVQGSDGNFYGSTYAGGNPAYAGSLYEITPTGTFSTLYLFCSQTNCADGDEAGALMQATNGEFYGTTAGGGTGNHGIDGTVFSLSTGLGPFVAARPNFGPAGQAVTILGNGLTGTTSVMFNGTPAKFQVISNTYLKAQVPSGATTGTIVVTTPTGTLNSNVAFQIE